MDRRFPKVSTRVLWMARNLDDRRPAAAMEATGATLFRGEGTLTDREPSSSGPSSWSRVAPW
jgi:hypothetical protein